MNIMITTLKSIASCEALGVMEKLLRPCFGHYFFEAYQYATIE
jgi:hypothetical protein